LKNKGDEFEKLKAQMKQLEDENRNKKTYITNLESDLSTITELSAQVAKQAMEINSLKEIIDAKNIENETLHTSISNVQSILEENDVFS
jgi:hypothetical protein